MADEALKEFDPEKESIEDFKECLNFIVWLISLRKKARISGKKSAIHNFSQYICKTQDVSKPHADVRTYNGWHNGTVVSSLA